MVCRTELCDRCFSYVFFQPVDKFCHSYAVFDMGDALVFHLNRIFDGFWKKGKIFFIQNLHTFRKAADQTAVCAFSGKKNGSVLRNGFHILVNIIVRLQNYAVFFQRGSYCGIKGLLIGKKKNLILGHNKIGKHYRAAVDIVSADI